MTDLVIRRLLVDMEAPIGRHWCDGDAWRTAFLNALSMGFPVGEQFFIDAVREGHKALPEELSDRMKNEVKGFLGQEATHRRLHGLYNQHLEELGLDNQWGPRAAERQSAFAGADVRHPLAVTAAYEHFTAIFADWLLKNPELLGTRDARLATLWQWHSAEESEHRSIAFDLYRALGGNEEWRIKWFRKISIVFATDALRQTLLNLKLDGTLWHWRTWVSAATFLFGRKGLVRTIRQPWRDYLRADFHPTDHDDTSSRAWLESNQTAYVPVGG